MNISRRDFLQAAATGATVAALGLTTQAEDAVAGPTHTVRRGVATYSYQEEFFVRQMSVEDIIREMADIGCYGFELIAEMLVPNFPNPSDAWVDQWHGWMDQYKIKPVAYTQFIDSMRTKRHNLTLDEGVETMLRDIKLAKRLGIAKIRALIGTPVSVLEATLPLLEKHDIWLGVELHAPITIDGPLMHRLLQISEKSTHFGFVPDFGIFQNKPNPYARDHMIREGVITADAAAYIESSWAAKADREKVRAEVARMAGGPAASGYVDQVYMITTQDPRDLLPFMAKCRHIHGKTWGLDEHCVDPAIDLTQVIPTLIKGGYDGVIATEYEGQRHVQDIQPFSAVEMVRRHHVMMRRLLGEI